jgi:hypothetical protein
MLCIRERTIPTFEPMKMQTDATKEIAVSQFFAKDLMEKISRSVADRGHGPEP